MLVEDDPSLRELLEVMFEIWGRIPLAFVDGNQVMAWLDEVEANRNTNPLPQLALLDIRIPGPQGDEVARRMREIPATASMPIVIMSAYYLDPGEREKIIRTAQPDQFISKPLPSPDELVKILEDVIHNNKRQKGLPDDGMQTGDPIP